jgi:hypothetical protein
MTRPVYAIAADIRKDWTKVNVAALPYLEAMESIEDVNEDYFQDSAKSVVLYFLSNASSWRGDTARIIKAELKGMVKP